MRFFDFTPAGILCSLEVGFRKEHLCVILYRNIPHRHKSAYSLLFIPILAGNIILRHLMRTNFPLVSVPGVLHALHRVGL